jgi:hypothetical protein
VRTVDGGEVHLESYDTLASVDLLADHMVASMLAGLSDRRYASALEPVGEALQASAHSSRDKTLKQDCSLRRIIPQGASTHLLTTDADGINMLHRAAIGSPS